MRYALCLAVLAALCPSAVAAAPKQCQSIKSITVRQACLDREASERAEKRAPGASDNPQMMNEVERMKLEDDRLAKRLKGICRGC